MRDEKLQNETSYVSPFSRCSNLNWIWTLFQVYVLKSFQIYIHKHQIRSYLAFDRLQTFHCLYVFVFKMWDRSSFLNLFQIPKIYYRWWSQMYSFLAFKSCLHSNFDHSSYAWNEFIYSLDRRASDSQRISIW